MRIDMGLVKFSNMVLNQTMCFTAQDKSTTGMQFRGIMLLNLCVVQSKWGNWDLIGILQINNKIIALLLNKFTTWT